VSTHVIMYGWKSKFSRLLKDSLQLIASVLQLIQIPSVLPCIIHYRNSKTYHIQSARISTILCTCKACILSMDFATVGWKPRGDSKGFIDGQTDHVSLGVGSPTFVMIIDRCKCLCNLIAPSAATVFHQHVGWSFRYLPHRP
jgi:hypothetical protein